MHPTALAMTFIKCFLSKKSTLTTFYQPKKSPL
jgi:hypothetical protein